MIPDPANDCPWCGGLLSVVYGTVTCGSCRAVIARVPDRPTVADETARERQVYNGGPQVVEVPK